MSIHIDIESFSELDLKKVGAYRYSLHPSTKLLCISWAIEDQPVQQWRCWESSEQAPDALCHVLNHGHDFVAWNASFERWMLGHLLLERLLEPRLWRCAAVKSKYHGIPLALEDAGIVTNSPYPKDMKGHRVMLKLCKPRKPSKHNKATRWTPEAVPGDYETLASYCDRDVEAERWLWHQTGDLPDNEWDLYWIDQTINDRGVRVDMTSIDRVIEMSGQHKQALSDECHERFGFTPTQTEEVRAYLDIDNIQAETIRRFIADTDDDKKRDVAQYRQEHAKTSVSKYTAMKNFASDDQRIHGMFQFYGQLPGRWSGRAVQLNNLPRAHFDDHDPVIEDLQVMSPTEMELLHSCSYMETLSKLVRPMLIAEDGRVFCVVDFNSIEAIVLPWLSKSPDAQYILDDYKNGIDLYIVQADRMSQERFIGKVAVLSLGYGGAAGAFVGMAKNYGVVVLEHDAKRYVRQWHKANEWAQVFWDQLWYAALKAFDNKGKAYTAGRVKYGYDGTSLRCGLPSGRILYYRNIIEIEAKFGGRGLAYEKHAGVVEEMWYGSLAENITMATARDIFAHGLQTIEADGFETVLHVYDEYAGEVDAGDTGAVERIVDIITTNLPVWAAGLPMRADGFLSRRYRKG